MGKIVVKMYCIVTNTQGDGNGNIMVKYDHS